jgi:hypothetical protein
MIFSDLGQGAAASNKILVNAAILSLELRYRF